MTNETKQSPVTHWKRLTNPKYLGSHDLQPGQKAKLTIERIVKEVVKDQNGKDGECIVAYMRGTKPMILNKTNCKIISKVYDTNYIEDWIGKQITIYSAKVKVAGDVVDALRVEAVKP
jgi:hypothetical protein